LFLLNYCSCYGIMCLVLQPVLDDRLNNKAQEQVYSYFQVSNIITLSKRSCLLWFFSVSFPVDCKMVNFLTAPRSCLARRASHWHATSQFQSPICQQHS